MSLATGVSLTPEIFNSGGGSLTYIVYNAPTPVNYTNYNETIYTTSLQAGTYFISVTGSVIYNNGATTPTQTNIITIGTGVNQNVNLVTGDYTDQTYLSINAIQTISTTTPLEIYMECFNFNTDWELASLNVNVIKIA